MPHLTWKVVQVSLYNAYKTKWIGVAWKNIWVEKRIKSFNAAHRFKPDLDQEFLQWFSNNIALATKFRALQELKNPQG